MARRLLSALLFVLMLACSSAPKPLEEVLPAQAGAWTRSQVSAMDPSTAPEVVRQLGLKRAASAIYTGPSSIPVRVYEMNVGASAFELIQKWRQQDGKAVYAGPYFVVADPQAGTDAPGLLAELQKQLQ